MIRATTNFLLVEIEKKFQDHVGNIFVDTTWLPEEHATVEGKVISVPEKISTDGFRKITGNVDAGDKIFFSYAVIFDYKSQPDNDTPVYKNLILLDGREYWKVNFSEIFCVISKGGEYRMVTDNFLIKEDEVVALPANTHISCKPGDKIIYQRDYSQAYKILGNTYTFVPERRVIAKKI